MSNDEQSPEKKAHDDRREERLRKERLEARKYLLKKHAKRALIILAVLLPIAWGGWYVATRPETPESEILSQDGLHWHSQLTIDIKGQRQNIPTDIGLKGSIHYPIHTHDETGEIHLEMTGVVKKSDTTLGNFFRIWGKRFDRTCIFDSCNGDQGTVRMYVNGKENTEFEKYEMKDKDKIEIKFE